MRSTTPVASSPLCSATSLRTLSRSRSWMWRRTACLAVFDGDGLVVVDGDAQRAPRLARLVERVQLITHVVERGLEQLFDRRYGPGRHVPQLQLPYRTHRETDCRRFRVIPVGIPRNCRRFRVTGQRSGCSLRQTTSSGAALKIELYVP